MLRVLRALHFFRKRPARTEGAGEDRYDLLAEPGVGRLAALSVPDELREWGDPVASAREDREIMTAFTNLRRQAIAADACRDGEAAEVSPDAVKATDERS